METTIVNVQKKNIEKNGYNNLKEWCEDDNNVYIGRKGIVFINKERYPKENSLFHNPFKINKNIDRDEAILNYKIHLLTSLKENKELQNDFNKLRGKTLGCWCKPEQCHGDTIIELLNTDNLFENINEIIFSEQKKLDRFIKINNIKKEIKGELDMKDDYYNGFQVTDKDEFYNFLCEKIDKLASKL